MTIDDKNFVAYKLQGNIYDEQGKGDLALDSFHKCYALSKKIRT